MLDFSNLNNNLEGSTLTNVITIALVSFVLSSIIALTYERTSREIESPKYFIQSLILISIPVATVMQAIGDSLARGLGMLGALAIIRFRTTLTNPRNMVFMFTSIAAGIASGVYSIPIAIIGTLSFCSIVFVVHFSPISKNTDEIGILEFEIADEDIETNEFRQNIEVFLKDNCIRHTLRRYNIKGRKGISEKVSFLEFKIKVMHKERGSDIVNKLSNMEGVSNVVINFKSSNGKI